jgi:hypothetical protein
VLVEADVPVDVVVADPLDAVPPEAPPVVLPLDAAVTVAPADPAVDVAVLPVEGVPVVDPDVAPLLPFDPLVTLAEPCDPVDAPPEAVAALPPAPVESILQAAVIAKANTGSARIWTDSGFIGAPFF